MINLLPTPKHYEFLDEKYHAIALGVTTEVADWADIVEGFCESFEKVFEESVFTAVPSITGSPAMVTKGVQLVADTYKDNVLLSIAKSVEGLEA